MTPPTGFPGLDSTVKDPSVTYEPQILTLPPGLTTTEPK